MKTVLVIGAVWPEPNSTAAGSRMLQLLDFFLVNNYKVNFACAAAANSNTEALEKKNVETRQILLNNSQFDDFLKEINPKIVIFDRFIIEEQYNWRVHKICPHAFTILDTEDLHFLREFRRLRLKKPSVVSVRELEITKREIASIYRCDLTLIISEEEMEILRSEFHIPDELLFYLPFLLDEIAPDFLSQLPNFSMRTDFICLGNFRHAPNQDAVNFLKEKIWPEIHQTIPEAKMLVFGAYSNSGDQRFHDPAVNFYIKGYSPEVHQEMANVRVQLAPLRFGAGLKGKFITGLLAGTPAVTTG
ncbi:MAG: glycosyltransferase family 4 protein, partial [Gillisia sp.]